MTTALAAPTLTGEEIVALCRAHTIFEWSAQSKVDPIPVARAEGVYFWTPEGKRYLDFNSQLMCTNIGHSHPKVVKAIQEQAAKLAYANPFMATEPRARLGAKLAEITPGDIDDLLLHERRRRGQRERDPHRAGRDRPPQDPGALPLVPRRHRGRDRAHRRPAALGRRAGAARASCAPPTSTSGRARSRSRSTACLREIEDVIRYEGAANIAAFLMETVVGTNGILIPPDGYMQGVREICDRHGILLIADEVMSGFGRTGKWFAVDHWKVVPDLITMAKGLTSAYVQLGAVGMRPQLAKAFQERAFPGGLTYNSHPLACATALATIARLRGRGPARRTRERMGKVLRQRMVELEKKHPSVGATRSIGLFGIFELVRSRKTFEPMAPYNGTSDEMAALGRFFREQRPLHLRALEHVLHEPAAHDHRGAARRGPGGDRQGARDHGPRREGLRARYRGTRRDDSG